MDNRPQHDPRHHLRPLGAKTPGATGPAKPSAPRDLSLAPTLGLNLARTRHLLDLVYALRAQSGAMVAQLHGVTPQTGRYASPDGPGSEVVEQDLGLPRAQSILLDRLELHLEALRQELGQLAETF